ncbi:MAG: hypothetical protein EOP51_23260 [Sphingobacteriales bacterium]|nr:MAG: hypothetical protein EOP51_23260 [Sphingobacteriales bacterium]
MKIKYVLSVAAIVAFTNGAFAQFSQDAVTFSTSQDGTTSRIKALGGAGTAVGGDISCVGLNPAGLGFFTKSELSITPEFNGVSSKSTFYNTTISKNRNTGNLANASVVLYNQVKKPAGADKTKGWLSVNYGVAYNHTNNFNYNAIMEGRGSNGSSIADWYADLGTKSNYVPTGSTDPQFPEGSLEGFGYYQGLINTSGPIQIDNGTRYYNMVPVTAVGPSQRVDILRKDGQSEYNVAIGANHSNKLYLGASVGITNIRYDYSSIFTEEGVTDENQPENYNTGYIVNQSTRGTGFNLKVGAIYKPVNAVRLGATITTPTWYNLEDVYSEDVETKFANSPYQTNGNTYGTRYDLKTPFKASAGIAIFAGDRGFITGDVEYIDYSGARISSPDYDPGDDNLDIKEGYKSAVNLKAGAEARVTNNVFLRGGYSVQGTPQADLQSAIKTVSGGIGFRKGAYYLDATYTRSTGTYFYAPYQVSDNYINNSTVAITNPYSDIKRQFNNVFVTFGYRFN